MLINTKDLDKSEEFYRRNEKQNIRFKRQNNQKKNNNNNEKEKNIKMLMRH